MDRGAWRPAVHGVTKSWTQLNTTKRLKRIAVNVYRASLVAQAVKNLPEMQELLAIAGDPGLIPGWEDPWRRNPAYSCILAWRIPCIEEPGGLYSPWGHKELDKTERPTK